METKVRTPHLYTLPKIHKRLDNPPGRPIVSSNQAPTERISCFVDQYLKPLVKQLPAYIKDTKDFLCHLRTLQDLPEDALLFTMDVVGLYTNIPHADGLKACEAILNSREVEEPPTKEIVELATLVLTCNSFQFEDDHYLQIKGTAMGTRMAPSYANLFMGQLEKTILMTAPENHVPGFYKRFPDDVFGIWLHGEQAFLEFIAHANSVNSDIKFTHTVGHRVDFLDVTVSLVNGQISTDLFTKQTDTHQYLLPNSDHPPHVHRNLPFGLGLRITSIVSDEVQFLVRLGELSRFLTNRGYSQSLVERQLERVRGVSRDSLLQKASSRTRGGDDQRVPLVCTWSRFLPNFTSLLAAALPIIRSTGRLKSILKQPLVSYRRPRNLRNILVHTSPIVSSQDPSAGTYPCGVTRCKTCQHIKNLTSIGLDNAASPSKFEVRQHFTCVSSSVVYFIQCSLCNCVYVGETGCKVRERMNQHRFDISRHNDTPVAAHFCLPGHNLQISVLQSTQDSVIMRRLIERTWISRIRSMPGYFVINRNDGINILQL